MRGAYEGTVILLALRLTHSKAAGGNSEGGVNVRANIRRCDDACAGYGRLDLTTTMSRKAVDALSFRRSKVVRYCIGGQCQTSYTHEENNHADI